MRQTELAFRINPALNMNGFEFQQLALKLFSLEYSAYDDFVKKYGPLTSEKPESMAVHAVCNFFEGVGLLLRRNLVDIDMVGDYYGDSAVFAWEKLKPLIEGLRKQYNTPRVWEPFEYLYNEMKKRKQAGVKIG